MTDDPKYPWDVGHGPKAPAVKGKWKSWCVVIALAVGAIAAGATLGLLH